MSRYTQTACPKCDSSDAFTIYDDGAHCFSCNYSTKKVSKEMNDFIESLSSEQFGKIQNFFNTMPKLEHEVEVLNPKTKVTSKVKLQGLQSFFVSPSHMTA